MLKVLLCTPYSESPKVAKGGINTWGRYVMSYYAESGQGEVNIVPVCFDRTQAVSNYKWHIRLFNGIKESLAPVRYAVRLIRKREAEIIHICSSGGFGLFRDILLVAVARRNKLRPVIHFHFGRIPQLAERRNWEWRTLKKIVEWCDKVIVMDRRSEGTLINDGATNIVYLPNPLGLETQKILQELYGKYARIPRRLLYVGHVLKTKGVYELVQACSQLQNIELRLVGKYFSEVRNELETIAGKNGSGEWLKFIGEVSPQVVMEEFLKADLFVFPSYSEGFPNVIMEAMAAGCPIIASDVGAIPEMLDVDGNPCGLCVPAQSVDLLYDAMKKVLGNSAMKTQFADVAYHRVLDSYLIQKVWKQLVEIWRP